MMESARVLANAGELEAGRASEIAGRILVGSFKEVSAAIVVSYGKSQPIRGQGGRRWFSDRFLEHTLVAVQMCCEPITTQPSSRSSAAQSTRQPPLGVGDFRDRESVWGLSTGSETDTSCGSGG